MLDDLPMGDPEELAIVREVIDGKINEALELFRRAPRLAEGGEIPAPRCSSQIPGPPPAAPPSSRSSD